MKLFKDKTIRVISLITVLTLSALILAGCGHNIEPEVTLDPPITKDLPVTTVPEATTDATTTTEPPPVEPDPLEKYLDYYEQNNDFVGWVRIDGLTHSNGEPYINHPVVQTGNNKYYINHSFEGKKSDTGCIFADFKVPITGLSMADNVTLYGHNWRGTSLFFSRLLKYQTTGSTKLINDAYIINFDTRWEEGEYVIVSCFLIGIYDWQDELPLFEYFKCRTFESEADYNYFYENIMIRNYYKTEVECEYGDQFLTLSTCSDRTDADLRFVVVARKVREGEDPSVYAGTYEYNPDRHLPSRYYE